MPTTFFIALLQKYWPWLLTFSVGLILWFAPVPGGLSAHAWHLFAIFMATLVGIITKPLPMGAVVVVGLTVAISSQTITLQEGLEHFSAPMVWLIVFAFFIARGLIQTGLGTRIAYHFIAVFGSSALGLAYALTIAEFILAPAIPSNTARGAGIVFPIVKSLSEALGSTPQNGTERKLGAFLIQTCFQNNALVSGLFITAMAGNPIIVKLAADCDIHLSWSTWAIAMIVPGLIHMLILPLVMYILCPPDLKKTPHAPHIARQKLQELGPLSMREWTMLGIFLTLLSLWIFGDFFHISATTVAMIGFSALLIFKILTWDDVLKEKSAWDTLLWFTILLTLASLLNKFGLIKWLGGQIQNQVAGYSWQVALGILVLVYFYIHYLFASVTSHISVLFGAFLMVSITTGSPPYLAVLTLTIASNLSGGLTHYGNGSAPAFFGAGYHTIAGWWRVGALSSLIGLGLWSTIGILWWKTIDLF